MTSSAIIRRDSYLLIDTGGHYLEGTTDITRTVMLGKANDEEKLHYTLVLKGNLKLGAAKFTYGCKGQNLDYLARESLWERGLDYNHGTGHGVGYLLNVHEGPNSIRSRISNVKNPDAEILREGMITSNEPGIYLEGKYGIRLENLIVCKKLEKTEYGQFMGFETLTLVPFDMDAIDLNLLTDREISILRDYHKRVYETLEIYLSDEEKNWLYTLCNF
jgi:Xaa-Pro aminopeptidase